MDFLYDDISVQSDPSGRERQILLAYTDNFLQTIPLGEFTLTIPPNTRIMDLNGLPFAGDSYQRGDP